MDSHQIPDWDSLIHEEIDGRLKQIRQINDSVTKLNIASRPRLSEFTDTNA